MRLPHEPAFTVESFAMTHTVRRATRPMPVTTPSAGRSPACTFARSASSTKEPSSRSNASRSRQKSLPCFSAASWYLGAPPRRTSSVTLCK